MIEHAKVCYHFPNPIAISDEDAKLYATSFIRIENNILVPKGISEELRTSLLGLGLNIIEIKVDEFVKGGQGLRSLCLFL
jgi:N-dimethylarginine dimethylaminohydrolase